MISSDAVDIDKPPGLQPVTRRRPFGVRPATAGERLDAERRMASLLTAFESRPSGESSWTALRAALSALQERPEEPDPQWAAQARLAREHPSVLARLLRQYAEFERALADLIATRSNLAPGGVRPRVMAGAFMTALRIAASTGIEECPLRPLAELAEETLTEMARPFD